MGPLTLLLHLLNFVAPALGMGLALAAFGWWTRGGSRWSSLGWRHAWQSFAWVFAGGTLVLLGGLLVFGRDGKMATYAALVLVCGTVATWRQAR